MMEKADLHGNPGKPRPRRGKYQNMVQSEGANYDLWAQQISAKFFPFGGRRLQLTVAYP